MRKVLAFVIGLSTWSAAFAAIQLVGFIVWNIEPGVIASELLIGFFGSLISLSIAEFFIKKITPEIEIKNIMGSVGLTVTAIYALVLLSGQEPKYGYAVLISGLIASVLPFLKFIIKK